MAGEPEVIIGSQIEDMLAGHAQPSFEAESPFGFKRVAEALFEGGHGLFSAIRSSRRLHLTDLTKYKPCRSERSEESSKHRSCNFELR
jgi:hypothetical protein